MKTFLYIDMIGFIHPVQAKTRKDAWAKILLTNETKDTFFIDLYEAQTKLKEQGIQKVYFLNISKEGNPIHSQISTL